MPRGLAWNQIARDGFASEIDWAMDAIRDHAHVTFTGIV